MSDLLKTAHFLSCTAQAPRVGSARRLRAALFACAVAVLAVLAFSGVSPEKAYAYSETAGTVEVSTVDELIEQIKISRQQQYNRNVVLTADIDLTDNGDKIDQIIRELGSLTFGSKDYPFTGGFDGQGHYIIGLNYKRDLWVPAANTGLFSFTDGAYLHDINFRDCYIGADFRAGVLVGQAKNTRIESVRMVNCTLSVTPANNAVSLITNAGVMGGMIAGEMQGSSMYNCTVQGGRVVNNSVVAVSGLGGEGLYLGAMVGSAGNSVIEYCRVLPTEQYYADRVDDPDLDPYAYDTGKYPYLTEVYNRYEVAVGAVAGQGVYVGGVLGYANDVDVVDCFSTAWAHTWVANYVGVGSGNIGYVGGIIAHAKSATEGANASQIIRCHFAGNMESYQWNSLAIIPIIQSNVYLAGLVERDWEEDTGLYNSYFKRNLINGMENKIKPYPEGYVRTCGDWLGLDYSGSQSVSGYTYGPIVDDEQYKSRSFWEGEGYDFAGNIERRPTQNTDDPIVSGDATHINKWVIDERLGIPVHGSSVKATLDFPGAGSAEIGPSSIDRTIQVTSDPYNFAVQGVSATEAELTFTAAVNNDKANNPALSEVSHEKNGGFRFQGWYRAPGVTANHIQQGSHKFFDPLVPLEPNVEQVYNNETDKLNLVYKAENTSTGDNRATDFADNDLFVAYYQAQVLFHDVNGQVINKGSSATETAPDATDDWYNHQDKLPKVAEPQNRGNVSATAKFLGWTTEPNTAGSHGGYPDIDNAALSNLKAAGKFFEGGEPIERPMDLYPVYADLKSNVKVIVEGHELDGVDPDGNEKIFERAGVAQGVVAGDKGEYTLNVKGWNKDTGSWGDVLPDGYRFLGWYRVNVDAEGNPVKTDVLGVRVGNATETTTAYQYDLGLRVSQTPEYKIPDSDLTAPCYYYARFEYRVDYWAATSTSEDSSEWDNPQLFSSAWETYLAAFENIDGPHFYDWYVGHWSLGDINAHVEGDDAQAALAAGIVCPQRVNGHNVRDDGVDDNNYGIDIFYDFPNSAKLWFERVPSEAGFTVVANPYSGFEARGWTRLRADGEKVSDQNQSRWQTGIHLTTAEYWYEAHLVAQVRFMSSDAAATDPLSAVTRAYSNHEVDKGKFANGFQTVFMDNDVAYEYRFPKRAGAQSSEKLCGLKTTSAASPSRQAMELERPDSYFVGWIDQSAIANGTMTQAEYDAVYDQDTRTAKSLQAVLPYIVPDDALCERPMTLYPVYADFDVTSTTNITRGTNLTDPANPTFDVATPSMGNGGVKSVAFAADVDAATTANYDLVSWTVESPDGTVIDTITEVGNAPVGKTNASLTYNINPGQSYVVVANYEAKSAASLSVTYHVSDSDPKTTVYTKTYGDMLGKGPQPQFAGADLDNAIFAGWTETMPTTGDYHIGTDNLTLTNENDVVYKSTELWPVYRAVNVAAVSNIDAAHANPDDHRGVKVIDVKTGQQLDQSGKPIYTYKKAAQLWATDVEGYIFKGWYLGYASDAQPGTRVSAERDHLLSDEAAFAGNTYTAVYVASATPQNYAVRYHFPDGTVAEELIPSDSKDAFVGKVQVSKPVLDADGMPTYDAEGNPLVQVETVEGMIHGGEATAAVAAQFDEASKASNATFYEQFKEWRWVKSGTGGSIVAWDDFCTKPIIESIQSQGIDATVMDLYPVSYRFSAEEWQKAPDAGAFKPYSPSNLVWYLNPAAKDQEQAVKVAFKPGVLYLSDKLAINMKKAVYGEAGSDGKLTVTEAGVDDKRVGLYADFTDVSDKSAKPLDEKITGDKGATPPFDSGQVIFTFKNEGSLVIEKTAPAEADNGTFAFTVTECAANGTAVPDAKSATVYVTVKKTADGSIARGSVKLDLPWGYYRVAENGWGWQYNPTCKLLMNGFENQNLSEGVILIKSTNNQAQVTNTHNSEGFKDGEARTKNEFGQGTGGSQPTTRSAKIANPTAEGGN